MNLYYVKVRSFERNLNARFLATANSIEVAEAMVVESMGSDWKPVASQVVCPTTQPIFEELL